MCDITYTPSHFTGVLGFVCFLIRRRSGATMDDNSVSDSNVKVAVRVRPMNRRGEYKRLHSLVSVKPFKGNRPPSKGSIGPALHPYLSPCLLSFNFW